MYKLFFVNWETSYFREFTSVCWGWFFQHTCTSSGVGLCPIISIAITSEAGRAATSITPNGVCAGCIRWGTSIQCCIGAFIDICRRPQGTPSKMTYSGNWKLLAGHIKCAPNEILRTVSRNWTLKQWTSMWCFRNSPVGFIQHLGKMLSMI
jgi:hypothetical protein